MNIDLIGGVLRGVLGARRKRSRNALRFLTRGHQGGGLLSNPSTLLTAAGVAWGIFETLQQRSTSANSPAGALPGPTPPGGSTAASVPPPLPTATGISEDALQLIRLAISAANADGAITEREHAAIAQQAKGAGLAEVVERELAKPRPLAEIVSGVTDPAQAATLYVLAFTIVRADEQTSGSERIYLAQLANLLGLEPSLVQALEKDTGERIDALGDQGQPGG
jgi:uncharacterized membrane protein YebE (DUF533 family)